MNDLKVFSTDVIPVYTTDTNEEVVKGRELHEALEIETPYLKWFQRMAEYGFEEPRDFWTNLSESTGGRPSTDHILKFDMAKHICMIQRTEVGKRIRQKLIDLEKEVTSGRIFQVSEPVRTPRLGEVNSAAKTITQIFKAAGVDDRYIAVSVAQLYNEKAGTHLMMPAEVETPDVYDKNEIAQKLGIFSTSGKPHPAAIGAIIQQLDIPDDLVLTVPYMKNGHSGSVQKYMYEAVDMIRSWIEDNHNPLIISGNGKSYKVQYKSEISA